MKLVGHRDYLRFHLVIVLKFEYIHVFQRSINTVPSWKENQIFSPVGATQISDVLTGNLGFNSSNTTGMFRC